MWMRQGKWLYSLSIYWRRNCSFVPTAELCDQRNIYMFFYLSPCLQILDEKRLVGISGSPNEHDLGIQRLFFHSWCEFKMFMWTNLFLRMFQIHKKKRTPNSLAKWIRLHLILKLIHCWSPPFPCDPWRTLSLSLSPSSGDLSSTHWMNNMFTVTTSSSHLCTSETWGW